MASSRLKQTGKRDKETRRRGDKEKRSARKEKTMKIEIIANIQNEDLVADPGPPEKPNIQDIREEIARKFINEGWAIARPDLEEQHSEVERAVAGKRETAVHPANKK